MIVSTARNTPLQQRDLCHFEYSIISAAERPHYSNDTYVSNNLAVVHVYFKSLHFMRQERAELFGIVDFFSNVGGLLGLCMGVRGANQ